MKSRGNKVSTHPVEKGLPIGGRLFLIEYKSKGYIIVRQNTNAQKMKNQKKLLRTYGVIILK